MLTQILTKKSEYNEIKKNDNIVNQNYCEKNIIML